MSRQRDGRLSARERGYDSRWERARAAFLDEHPLCVMCDATGRATAATVVDHVRPHKGDQARFWDRGNWQPLCARCHSSIKQRHERGGRLAIGLDGWPLEPATREG